MTKQFNLSALAEKIRAAKESQALSSHKTIESTTKTLPLPALRVQLPSNTMTNLLEIVEQQVKELTGVPSEELIRIEEVSRENDYSTSLDKYGNTIHLNSRQTEFVKLATAGRSCALIGAAGTGKTTTQRAAINALIDSGLIPPIGKHEHSHLPQSESALGIVICAFTRRATNNIRRNMSEDLQSNCITIHKLLEYQPVEVTVTDPETGRDRTTKPFLPTRNSSHPLPDTIKTIIIEEASMVSIQLYQEIIDACPHKPQLIFLGDIQQLPPVFGAAILGFALNSLPVIELTEVYRQALESPILSLAHRILSGNPILPSALEQWNQKEKGLILHPWKKSISPESATTLLAKFFISALAKGEYNPETDGILIPFNKSCGTIELNAHIANSIARTEGRTTYQILHGFLASYYSIGDKCLYDKEDAIILDIYPNPGYAGKTPLVEATNLSYWGHYISSDDPNAIDPSFHHSTEIDGEEDVDALLEMVHSAGYEGDDEERTRAASHKIKLKLLDTDREVTISSAGDMKKLDLGYAITVHKSQGSEWEKVFLCLHKSHSTMLQRELLYTACTRAKSQLMIICEKDSFQKGIESQRIKGNTLQDKAQYFKGRYDESEVPTFW